MFLDPEPRGQQSRPSTSSSKAQSNRDSGSGVFSAPRDQHRTTIRRKALQERENNQQDPWPSNKTTVRLVKETPPPSGSTDNVREAAEHVPISGSDIENRKYALVHNRVSKPGSGASSQDIARINVSDGLQPTNETRHSSGSEGSSLLSTTPIHAQFATRAGIVRGPPLIWQSRRTSSRLSSQGDLSTSSTLFREGDSVFSQSERTSERESGFSEGSTLRSTPGLQEQEYQPRTKYEDSAAYVRQSSVSVLESLQEVSPDRSTVRVVQQTEGSESSEQPLDSEPSESPAVVRLQPSSQSLSDSDQRGSVIRRSSWRLSSTSSLPAPWSASRASLSLTPRHQRSQSSLAPSELTVGQPSSPYFVAYDSDSPRHRSSSQPLPPSFSVESIQARLQYPPVVRPETARSFGSISSSSSLDPRESTDTLPPLQVPKKRLRHKTAQLSLNQAVSAPSASSPTMADEDIDYLPYPREQFTSHLSTIASESDRQSRTASQALSHFSLGSGVLTGDDASSILPFSSQNGRRRISGPIESMISEPSPVAQGTSSEEEPGDMTLGVFRDESAKPEPLFQPRSQSTPAVDRKYDGPLPPLPPIPADVEEHTDKVSGLPARSLKSKRSGYSLRRRSNSTPSGRISESDRWSHASSIFPLWAKNFYGHGAALVSASKIDLSYPTPTRGRSEGPGHERNASQWTERSITSRLGTGYSELDEPDSPSSSHFLPSIFRPRTRGRANTDLGSRRLQKNKSKSKSKHSRPSNVGDGNRPDSLTIFSDPFPGARATDDTLPSGQPKWGVLKDGSEHPRPLPRKYSKQRRWNEMEFPRPMTKDRLSDFNIQDPHLAPSKRTSNRMSMWRAPSFAESFDSLWRSRCNRQILLFALGFILPPCWLLGAILPIPKKPMTAAEYEAEKGRFGEGQSEEDIQAAMMKHEAGDAERRWREEKSWLKGRWWRWLNRIMSVIGVLVIAAVIALVIVATH